MARCITYGSIRDVVSKTGIQLRTLLVQDGNAVGWVFKSPVSSMNGSPVSSMNVGVAV